MNAGRTILLLAALAGIATAAHGQAGRTVYAIDVTAAGSKSQGLRGRLYDGQGRPIEAGAEVRTPIGQFRWIECRRLWDSCGRWRVGPLPAVSSYVRPDPNLLGYRILREERRDGTHWRGELTGLPAAAAARRRIETPMGVFRWTSGRLGRTHWRGWLPAEWPDLPFDGGPEAGAGGTDGAR